jgi:hypothetical protein
MVLKVINGSSLLLPDEGDDKNYAKSQITTFRCFYFRELMEMVAPARFACVLPFVICNIFRKSYFRFSTFIRDAFFRIKLVRRRTFNTTYTKKVIPETVRLSTFNRDAFLSVACHVINTFSMVWHAQKELPNYTDPGWLSTLAHHTLYDTQHSTTWWRPSTVTQQRDTVTR